jgi:hypothetical protein
MKKYYLTKSINEESTVDSSSISNDKIDFKILPSSNENGLPFVIMPDIQGASLLDWAEQNQAIIDELIIKYRALVFRNFKKCTTQEFKQFIKITSNGELLDYHDRTTPRKIVEDKIYTSTEYPASEMIALHNEGSYWRKWPLKLYFYCMKPSEQGGATPIADCLAVRNRISPEIVEMFNEKKWMLVRNFGYGLGLPWRESFQTDDRQEVEKHCLSNNYQFEWESNDKLKICQIHPTETIHPITKERSWFNHAAFYNVHSLQPHIKKMLLSEFKLEELPFNTYFGDGSIIPEEIVKEINNAYSAEKIANPWLEGDLMILDNITVAHGREPYSGDRKILVGMSEPYSPY